MKSLRWMLSIWAIGMIMITGGLVFVGAPTTDRVLCFYGSNLRSELFGGLISIGAFLFALKTFIIVTLKRELYDSKAYTDRYRLSKQLDPSIQKLTSLNNLRIYLSFTVMCSFASACAHITIGFICHWIAALACCGLSLLSLYLFARSLSIMWVNLRDLIDSWELESASDAGVASDEESAEK